MRKNVYSIVVMFFIVLLLNGCASNNVKRFIPDLLHKETIEQHLTKKIVVNVTMPENDRNSIMCRMVGNVYLPNKMTYSKYIEDAFKKVLASANRLSQEKDCKRSLSVVLTRVDFNSVSGEWYIGADVNVGNSNPIKIVSATKFGTSWVGEYACKNVAEAFDEAVSNFVNKVLTNHDIIRKLENQT